MPTLTKDCLTSLYANNIVLVSEVIKENENDILSCSLKNILNNNKVSEKTILNKYFFILLKSSSLFKIANFEFLVSVINACKLPLEEVVVINYEKFKFSKEELNAFAKKTFLCFGLTGDELFIDTAIKEYIEYADMQKNIFILAHTLSSIQSNTDSKKKLWSVLQKILLQ